MALDPSNNTSLEQLALKGLREMLCLDGMEDSLFYC